VIEPVLKYTLVLGVLFALMTTGYLIYSPELTDSADNIDGNRSYYDTKHETASQTYSTDQADGGYIHDRGYSSDVNLNKKRSDNAWFDEVGEEVGLGNFDTREYVNSSQITPITEGDGQGVYVTDYNRDGKPDILGVINGNGLMYRNNGSRYSRTDVLPEINADIRSAHFLDYDGWDDLYLLSDQKSVFLENDDGKYKK
jgi:hypothetical protein